MKNGKTSPIEMDSKHLQKSKGKQNSKLYCHMALTSHPCFRKGPNNRNKERARPMHKYKAKARLTYPRSENCQILWRGS